MGRDRRRSSTARLVLVAMTAIIAVAVLPSAAAAAAPSTLWTPLSAKPAPTSRGAAPALRPRRFRAFSLDRSGMRSALETAPAERSGEPSLTVSLPAPGGGFERFAVRNAPVMAPSLSRQFPEIATFAGRGLDDRTATVRLDIGPIGFHASVRSSQGSWYIDPYFERDPRVYASYFGRDLADAHGTFVEGDLPQRAATGGSVAAALPSQVTLRTYRLALLSDPTYNDYFTDPADSRSAMNLKVYNAKVALIARVDQVYEEELAIRLVLIGATENLLNLATRAEMNQPDGPCGGASCFTYGPDDPSTPDTDESTGSAAFCAGETLEDTQTTLGQIVGAGSYDVGHVALGLDGGGVANLGVVGGQYKAWGCTGIPKPVGDFYAIDYVAHEMGHQFSANHPFNGTQHNCSGSNREPATSVEPGSGSSIMAYAGICRQDNLQPHSDPYFSQRSFEEITGYVSAALPPIDEVQNVGLRGFNGTDSFKLSYGASQSTLTVKRGAVGAGQVPYTNAGIKAAIESIPALTADTVTVDAFGHSGQLDDVPGASPVDDTGFQVTFDGGPLAGTDVPNNLAVTSAVGITGSVVGETEHGGTVANRGDTAVDTGDRRPVVTAPAPRSIPTRTPFSLTGSATDPDANPLTYMWEQNDAGGPVGTALADNTKRNGPLFRQFGTAAQVSDGDALLYHSPGEHAVDGNPTRVFPDLAQVVAGTTNQETGVCPPAPPDESPLDGLAPATPLSQAAVDCYSEFLPTRDWVGVNGTRTMHFRLTARDGGGGVGNADTALTIVPTAGPFRVTAPAAGTALGRGTAETVRWDVAGTNAAPISVSDVRITLSTDGGVTFPVVLAASTPNDGSEEVHIPDVPSTSARMRVEAIGNVFFDVSHGDVTIEYAPEVTNDAPSGSRQVAYSDAVTPTTITATDRDGAGSALTATATGLPAGLALTTGAPSDDAASPGRRTFTIAGTTSAAPGSYPVTVAVKDGAGASRSTTFTVAVTAESAMARYTGDQAVETARGTARLAARVTEMADGSAGDLRTALVSFSEKGKPLCGPVAASATGAASCSARLGRGRHTVDVAVRGSYSAAATSGTLAGPKPPVCATSVVLTEVSRHGGTVRVVGFTERRLAGQSAKLTAGGARVGSATIRPDGRFAASIKAPQGRGAERISYRAAVGALRSPAVRLGRALTITVKGPTLHGRLTGPNRAHRKLTLLRDTTCKPAKARTMRTDGRGRFKVKLPQAQRGTTVAYTVRTARGRPRSSSLQAVITRR